MRDKRDNYFNCFNFENDELDKCLILLCIFYVIPKMIVMQDLKLFFYPKLR